MASRRVDLVYFGLIFLVCLIGYFVSDWTEEEETATVDLSSLEPPELDLDVPFDFPYAIPEFKTRTAPTLVLSENMERVLAQVRAALLESSTPVEERPVEELAAVIE